MRLSRFILALLLIYEAMFLNIVLPGHTRGQITIDGKHTVDSNSCPLCCCCATETPASGPAVPSQRDREHCALCQFMAGLTSVPLIRLTLPELGLLELLPVPPPHSIVSLQLIPTYLACGPPVSTARV
jgi:hypothetical protein